MFNAKKFLGINFIVILAFIGVVLNTTPIKADALLQSPGPIHFAVIGDYGIAGQPELDVANRVKSWNPEFIITTGDNNYPSGSASTIDQNIGQYYHDYIYPYTGSYGSGAATNQFFPTLGNHEWDVANAQPYLDYFALPGNERYYDFVKGPVHFFVIDSDSHEPDGSTSTSTQALWLQSQLAASTSVWNIVYLHHPPFSSSSLQNTRLQWPFAAWGADAVFAGHSHTYERIFQNGITYFVNGLGGDDISTFGTPISGSQVRYNGDFGAMLVDASETEISYQFITRTGTVIDSYTLPDTTPPTVSSIVRASANPTTAASVNYTVTFSEDVTGVNTVAPFSDFALTTSPGISGASVASVSGSGAIYTVTVNTGSGNGTIRLDLVDKDNILDYVGNKLGGTGLGNGNFNGGETYTVDKTAPTVFSITRASANPTSASNVNFAVTFSEPVTGMDMTGPAFDDFTLATSPGISGASVTGVSGTGATYTVTVNTGSGSGTIRLDVPISATITDLAGNPLSGLPFNTGETYTVRSVDVYIGGALQGSYFLSAGESTVKKYALDGGPVEISSNNGAKIVASLYQWRRRPGTIPWTGITQSMALPVEQITNQYVMPRYDYSSPNSLLNQVLIANVDTVTRDITVKIGANVMGTYTLAPSASQYLRYDGVVGGPVVVSSVTGARIVASLYELVRDPSKTGWIGQSEMMGLPGSQLSDKYLIPMYFGASSPNTLKPYLYIANVDAMPTTVEVKIAGLSRGTYPLNPNTSTVKSYLVDGGPVEISSNNGAKIVVSLYQWRRRPGTTPWTGVTQSMALPVGQITNQYVMPRYDYTSPNSLLNQVLIANVDTVTRDITVKIGANVMGTYTLAPSASQYLRYEGVVGGPVVVSSVAGARIVASLYELVRDPNLSGWIGQSEMMGLPGSQLSDKYLIPMYFGASSPNTLQPSLYIGVP